jgi:hypothetical protein
VFEGRLNIIEACDKAERIVYKAKEIERLHRKAIRYLGVGALRTSVLNMAVEALEEEELKKEVFINNESLLSFFCGVWIQFLLIEIAGVKREKLQAIAQRVFEGIQEEKSLH